MFDIGAKRYAYVYATKEKARNKIHHLEQADYDGANIVPVFANYTGRWGDREAATFIVGEKYDAEHELYKLLPKEN